MNQLLQTILSTKRAHNSKGDLLFRSWLTKHIQSLGYIADIVGNGNIAVAVGKSCSLFCCHLDTVHNVEESDGTAQTLSEDFGLVGVMDSSCLGADDGVGIYIMLEMIRAGVPGVYLFHVGEEVGCQGSRYLAVHEREWLSTFERAIAFDRAVHPGQRPEVITHQSGMRCASDEMGQALADALNKVDPSLGYEPSDRGVLTDTLEYIEIVPECLNLGCFYDLQHSKAEYVDIERVEALKEACLVIDWESLPTKRDPHVVEDEPRWGYGMGSDVEVEMALDDWYDGDEEPIKGLIAETIWPEDPARVYKFIDMSRMNDDVAESAYRRGVDALIDALVVDL